MRARAPSRRLPQQLSAGSRRPGLRRAGRHCAWAGKAGPEARGEARPSTREPGDLPPPCTPSAGGAPSLTAGLGAPGAGDPCDDDREPTSATPASGPAANSKPLWRPSGPGEPTKPTPGHSAAALRAGSRGLQQGGGISHVPSADFALYDHVLETACALGAIPAGYGWSGEGPASLATLFALARGARGTRSGTRGRHPAGRRRARDDQVVRHQLPLPRAAAVRAPPASACCDEPLGRRCSGRAWRHGTPDPPGPARPGDLPAAGKTEDGSDPLDLLPRAAASLCRGTARHRRGRRGLGAGRRALPGHSTCQRARPRPIARPSHALADGRRPASPAADTYFGGAAATISPLAAGLPVAGLHLDLVRGAGTARRGAGRQCRRIAGSRSALVDGRNVWRADLRAALRPAAGARPAPASARRLMVAPSCSLLHVPHRSWHGDGARPARCSGASPSPTRSWPRWRRSHAALDEGEAAVAAALAESDRGPAEARADAGCTTRPGRAPRCRDAGDGAARQPIRGARAAQAARLRLPPLPVTTIGSFPQTPEVRALRAASRAARSPRPRTMRSLSG